LTRRKQDFISKIAQNNPNPPKRIALILGIFLWLLGVLGYFWLPIPQVIVIWSLVISTIILLLGSTFKQI